jgi:GPH family glycoside/pentoside/hexuronide:cation symporter
MGYELSTNTDERTHIFKWRTLAFAATGFVAPWLPWLCLRVEGEQHLLYNGSYGVHYISFAIAAVILLTALGPVIGCRERIRIAGEQKVGFLSAVGLTLRNFAFWPIILGKLATSFGMNVTGVFFYYIYLYRVGQGNQEFGAKEWGFFCNAINVATFLALFLIPILTDRIGKKQTVLLSMLLSAVAYGTVFWTFQPQIPKLGLITAVMIGVFCNTMAMVLNSMLADVCDVDELKSGHRREAFYGAVFVTCDKMAMAIALALQGFLLSYSGFNAALHVQTPETMDFWMKSLLFTQPTGFLLGFLCILFYPITRAKAIEVRRQLDARAAASYHS